MAIENSVTQRALRNLNYRDPQAAMELYPDHEYQPGRDHPNLENTIRLVETHRDIAKSIAAHTAQVDVAEWLIENAGSVEVMAHLVSNEQPFRDPDSRSRLWKLIGEKFQERPVLSYLAALCGAAARDGVDADWAVIDEWLNKPRCIHAYSQLRGTRAANRLLKGVVGMMTEENWTPAHRHVRTAWETGVERYRLADLLASVLGQVDDNAVVGEFIERWMRLNPLASYTADWEKWAPIWTKAANNPHLNEENWAKFYVMAGAYRDTRNVVGRAGAASNRSFPAPQGEDGTSETKPYPSESQRDAVVKIARKWGLPLCQWWKAAFAPDLDIASVWTHLTPEAVPWLIGAGVAPERVWEEISADHTSTYARPALVAAMAEHYPEGLAELRDAAKDTSTEEKRRLAEAAEQALLDWALQSAPGPETSTLVLNRYQRFGGREDPHIDWILENLDHLGDLQVKDRHAVRVEAALGDWLVGQIDGVEQWRLWMNLVDDWDGTYNQLLTVIKAGVREQ